MGAALLFKRTTGKEIGALTEGGVSDIISYVWCCVKSACRHDGIEFSYTLDDFADCVDIDGAEEWVAAMAAGNEAGEPADGQKKS